MKKTVIIIFVLLNSLNMFAHQDFWFVKEFGNIKVRIKTGFQYEEINNIQIIGKLSKLLSEKMNYYQPIFLDFNHYYVGECDPDYFISFDNGIIKYDWDDANNYTPLSKSGIVIRQVSNKFEIRKTLLLIEYAITNKRDIISNQKELKYNENYCNWTIKSIDTLKINRIIKTAVSKKVEKIMMNKIYRPNNEVKGKYSKSNSRKLDKFNNIRDFGITYYWLNNKYTIIDVDKNGNEKELLNVDHVYDFRQIDDWIFIFTSSSSFYFINSDNSITVSQEITINNSNGIYRLYQIEKANKNEALIYHYDSYNEDWSAFSKLVFDINLGRLTGEIRIEKN